MKQISTIITIRTIGKGRAGLAIFAGIMEGMFHYYKVTLLGSELAEVSMAEEANMPATATILGKDPIEDGGHNGVVVTA